MARLGVDAGTWSVAALLAEQDGGRRRVVPDPVTGLPWSRSSVARGPAGGWLVGESAEQIRPLHAGLYRDDVKRLLDSTEPVYLDGAPYRAQELLAQLIWQRAAQGWTMTDESLDGLVLGVPVSFEGARAEAVREAARLAGFRAEAVSLVLEPVAAARAALRGLRQSGTFLVFDLGGGTLDCSLVTAKSGTVEIVDSAGDSAIGGYRIDAAIVRHLRERFSIPQVDGDPADDLGESDLLATARAMKHQLSQDSTGYARNPHPAGDRTLTMTRADLERVTGPLMDAAITRAEELLAANKLDWPGLTATIATGGATRSPVIADRLRRKSTLIVPSQPPELLTAEGLLPLGDKPRIHARRLPAIRSVHTLSGPAAAFNAVAFNPDGTLVAAAGADGSIHVWDTATGNPYGRPLAGTEGHTGPVLSVAFSPDGSVLASGGTDDRVLLWDLRSQTPRALPLRNKGHVHALAFTRFKGEPALAAVAGTVVEFHDRGSGDCLGRLDPAVHSALTSLATWPEKDVLVAASGSNTFAAFRLSATEQLHAWQTAELTRRDIHVRGTTRLGPSSSISMTPQTVYLTGLHVDAVGLLAVALSPDGATVATGSRSGEIRVWKLAEAVATGTVLTGPRMPVTGLAWSPDGTLLASAGAGLRVWDPATRICRVLTAHRDELTDVQFSPDGTLIATSSLDNTVRLWGID